MEVRSANGATPLIDACASGFWSVSNILLDAGADAKARNDDDNNALYCTPADQGTVV